MSDRHLNRQHDEVNDRNRKAREARMRDAQDLAVQRNRRHGR
jgi:hypothetical protein